MAYRALYNKYRPQTFDEVVGQEGIVKTLKNAIATDHLAHAYLFTGPRGTGKTTMARLLAKALNCEEGMGHQCNHCSNCEAITNGSHPDVAEIDAASNNGVDQVRELISNVRYAPIKGRYKVYIIDEVHMMSAGAFNALLKTLEEPPERVLFILATTEPHKVLPTILSRCQRFDFAKIPDEQIKVHLEDILQKEGVAYEEPALDDVVSLADGGMRDALSILEQVLAYSGSKMTEADVLTLFGLTSNAQKAELLKLAAEGDVSTLLNELDGFVAGGIDIQRLSASLLDFLKDLLIYEKTHDPKLLSSLKENEAKDLVSSIDPATANAMIGILLDAQAQFKSVSNIRSLFELTMLRLANVKEVQKVTAAAPIMQTPAPQATSKAVAPKPARPRSFPAADDVPLFAKPAEPSPQKEEAPQVAPQPASLKAEDIKNPSLTNEGDSYELEEDTVIQIMVLGAGNKEERRALASNWSQLEGLKDHPTVGTLASLLSEGRPFCLCKEALLLTFNFSRLKEKTNIKANQPAIEAMVSQLIGRKVFVYGLDRMDTNKYYQDFINRQQVNKLPKKEDIQLVLPSAS